MRMNIGSFEIALLIGSAATLVAGGMAAVARRRAGAALAANVIFAAWFAYFAVIGFRFGGILEVGLSLLALTHGALASAIVSRATRAARPPNPAPQ
jgi:hypothetical protein